MICTRTLSFRPIETHFLDWELGKLWYLIFVTWMLFRSVDVVAARRCCYQMRWSDSQFLSFFVVHTISDYSWYDDWCCRRFYYYRVAAAIGAAILAATFRVAVLAATIGAATIGAATNDAAVSIAATIYAIGAAVLAATIGAATIGAATIGARCYYIFYHSCYDDLCWYQRSVLIFVVTIGVTPTIGAATRHATIIPHATIVAAIPGTVAFALTATVIAACYARCYYNHWKYNVQLSPTHLCATAVGTFNIYLSHR